MNDSKAFEKLTQIKKADQTAARSLLTGFIKEINASQNTTDQKVLLLREAMFLATDNDTKDMILWEAAKNKTVLSLVFMAEYLDNTALQQTAVQAVYHILTNQTKIYGDIAREIAEKAMAVNKSPKALQQNRNCKNSLRLLRKNRVLYLCLMVKILQDGKAW